MLRLTYPNLFSTAARNAVEAESHHAAEDFEKANPSKYPSDIRSDGQPYLCYIRRVFLAFAREACKLGSDGTWSMDRIREECRLFASRVVLGVLDLKAPDARWQPRFDRPLELLTNDDFGKGSEFVPFRQLLLGVAESSAAPEESNCAGGQVILRPEPGPNEFQRRAEAAKQLFWSESREGKPFEEAKDAALRFYEFSEPCQDVDGKWFVETVMGEERPLLTPTEKQDHDAHLAGLRRWFDRRERERATADAPPAPGASTKTPADLESRERSNDRHQPESGKQIEDASPQKRGRPAEFSQDQLDRALKLRLANSSNLDIARVLYGATPNEGQRRGVSTILKTHFPKQPLPPRVKQTLKK